MYCRDLGLIAHSAGYPERSPSADGHVKNTIDGRYQGANVATSPNIWDSRFAPSLGAGADAFAARIEAPVFGCYFARSLQVAAGF